MTEYSSTFWQDWEVVTIGRPDRLKLAHWPNGQGFNGPKDTDSCKGTFERYESMLVCDQCGLKLKG